MSTSSALAKWPRIEDAIVVNSGNSAIDVDSYKLYLPIQLDHVRRCFGSPVLVGSKPENIRR